MNRTTTMSILRPAAFCLIAGLLLGAAAFARMAPSDAPPAPNAPVGATLKLLTANVGNADIMNCTEYMYKLCVVKVEQKIAESIKKLNPDIVLLQEVYNIDFCEKRPQPEKNKRKVCYQYDKQPVRDQVRRLLGDGYTIVCDGRSNYECLGIRKGIGKIDGCDEGALCKGAPAAITLPAPRDCEPFPVIFAVDAEIGGVPIRLIDAHPAASKADCRAKDIEHMFRGYNNTPALADTIYHVLATGDLNMDPFAQSDDESAKIWRSYVGDNKPFYYLSGPAEHDPPYPTDAGRTIDQVITNFAKGKCETLGREEGKPRLDGAVGDANPEGTDHSPILCELTLAP